MNGRLRRSRSPAYAVLLTIGAVLAHAASSDDACSATTPISDAQAARFLQQASWGPDSKSIARVKQLGYAGWIEEQFQAPPSTITILPPGTPDLSSTYQEWTLNAITGTDQLRQRILFALSELWVVSQLKDFPAGIPPYLHVLQDNAFGNYRDLMEAMTLNPAMGRYLDMVYNWKPLPGTQANENYARELLQLFTIGLVKLNPDGTPKLDSSGQPLATYSLDDIKGLARALTGWEFVPHVYSMYYPMIPNEVRHDTDPKQLFDGHVLPAGQTAEQDLGQALDLIFQHPNVGPFISQQLIEHLVTSNPSPAYVQRVATVFDDNGAGVRGDLKSVIRAILLDPEARMCTSAVDLQSFGHLREPMLFVTALLRALDAQLPAKPSDTYGWFLAMGQPLFREPSVFSYFSPSFHIDDSHLGPEFQIDTPPVALWRVNFVTSLVYGPPDSAAWSVDLTPLVALEAQGDNVLLDHLAVLLLPNGILPASMRETVRHAMALAPTPLAKTQTAVWLMASSSLSQVTQ